ncbi:MAG: putative toxin-antitoxin system toxin component, PIN family [Gallionella sp.]
MNSDKTVILDTRTLIGAILKPHTLPAEVYYHASKHHRLIASKETIQEMMEVVGRDKFDRFRDRDERIKALSFYLSLVEIGNANVVVNDCRDPKDNKFLSLAISLSADMIISSDDDLLVLHPYKQTRILTVRQYAEEHGLR